MSMKVTFLGVGSTLSRINANSNILVECGGIKMCIDCGRSAFASAEQTGLSLKDITHVLITHLHADKISGLEEIAFMTKFVFKKRVKLLSTQTMLDRLWHCSLKGGLEYIEESPGDLKAHVLNNYYDVIEVKSERWESIADSTLEFYLHPTNHIQGMESYGVEVKEGQGDQKKQFFFSGGSKFDPELLKRNARHSSHIFHDCQIADHGDQHNLQWHATYSQLRELPSDLKKKIWLYHYEDSDLPNAQEDGFAGFAQHLQSFEF
ncbi:MAG: MBL fold metallo-hydrolase [SAR324 cluster bacterium]|nr:MBL fold metallo-hydrolase [SAR324 cluster bacterium]